MCFDEHFALTGVSHQVVWVSCVLNSVPVRIKMSSPHEVKRQSPIREFEIKGLLGDRDVRLKFDDFVTVLIADNGAGKTTLLGVLYAVLSGRLDRLRRLDFSEINVTFANGKTVHIPRGVVQARVNPRLQRVVGSQLKRVPPSFVEKLGSLAAMQTYEEFRRNPALMDLKRMVAPSQLAPSSLLYEVLRDYGAQIDLLSGLDSAHPKRVDQAVHEIGENFPYRVAYFPTYRRIEEELDNLGYTRSDGADGDVLMQFGMADVATRIKAVTDKIKSLSVEWFSKINGQILSQLVDGIRVEESDFARLSDKAALEIVLDRVGQNINANHKSHIIELVASNEIRSPAHATLAYFLSNLIQVYDHQKVLDNSIKRFVGVCNGYLVDKEIRYNEGRVEVAVTQKRNERPVDISRMSSGEKQLISLFSRIYLEDTDEIAVLFDEPELSLSVEWQKRLLPDVLGSGRCNFLVATTHSPFVFENELDVRARDLAGYISWTD